MIPYEAYTICLDENKRKPELETVILTDPWVCYFYAKNIIKGRWLEAEATILTDAYSCFCYASEVIKDRWTEYEPIIKQDDYYWKYYCLRFNIKLDKVDWKKGL